MPHNEIHQHPDGMVYVRMADGRLYENTYENFEADYETDLPDLPEGADEQIYTQGRRHCFMGDGNIVAGGDMPWEHGDQILANFDLGWGKQEARKAARKAAKAAAVEALAKAMAEGRAPK
jgi:hypothetical protein